MGTVKKKGKPPARALELEDVIARHKDHISRLEKVNAGGLWLMARSSARVADGSLAVGAV
jgi:hypothetical protein